MMSLSDHAPLGASRKRDTTFKLKAPHILILKVLAHAICFVWLFYTLYLGLSDQLGGDPVKTLLHFTGMGGLNLLVITLLVSPLARWSKQSQLIRMRRMLGLWAFAYAATHVLSYVWFELQLEWNMVISEIIKRPYITVGFAALCILFVLTITSFKAVQKTLGRRWQVLHHSVYAAALLVALHFIWSVKSGLVEPLIYWAAFLILLGLRASKLKRFYGNKKR